jgi:hypothetical protein
MVRLLLELLNLASTSVIYILVPSITQVQLHYCVFFLSQLQILTSSQAQSAAKRDSAYVSTAVCH